MHKTDATFELIRSMTANEKRFFRLQSGEEKNYLHVFDALDALEEYSSAALQKKLSGKKLNVSYEKNYLHGQLLRSLRLFHSDLTPAIFSDIMLHEAEILSGRMLYKQADHMIEKGIRHARENELYINELLFRQFTYRHANRSGNYDFMNRVEENIARDKELFRLAENLMEYRAIQQKFFAVAATKTVIGDKKTFAELAKLRKHPLLKNEKAALSFLAKVIYYEIVIFYHFLTSDYRQALDLCNKVIALFESHPDKMLIYPQGYYAFLNSACNRCLNMNRPEAVEAYVEKMEKMLSLKTKNLNAHTRAQIRWMVFEKRLISLTDLKKYAEVIRLGATHHDYISRNSESLRKEYLILYELYIAIAAYHTGDHKLALRHLNKLFDLEKYQLRTDYIIGGYYVFFCIHYERKNFSVISKYMARLGKLVEKQTPGYVSPRIVMDYFSVLIGSEKRSELLKAGKTALEQLGKVKDTHEDLLLSYFDIVEWIKGKM